MSEKISLDSSVIVLIIYRRTHQVLFGYVLPINISTTIESWINWKVT